MRIEKGTEILKTTKRGGASIFMVVLTIIILSIITLSFTRLIISESIKTTNTDLSQSAYDSALAGVEDAKLALLKYHSCLDQGYIAKSNGNECEKMIWNMQEGMRTNDCSVIQKALGREVSEDNSVIVQETQTSREGGNNANMLQAYTCVTIKEDLNDYRTTLNTDSRLRIIPIRSDQIDSLNRIEIQWFSQANADAAGTRFCGSDLYSIGNCNSGNRSPSVLSVRLIQTDKEFALSELSVSKDSNQTNTGTLFFVPRSGWSDNNISASAWGESANKGDNRPIDVDCRRGDWWCKVSIELPKTFRGTNDRNDANTYLLVSLPYGVPETDVSIMAYDVNGRHDFSGVQARIDSTGRANDLFRRVETRLELVDTYFAYPEFEITMTGGNGLIDKTFWVTYDCWYTSADDIDDSEEILDDDDILSGTTINTNNRTKITTCVNNYDDGNSSNF